MNNVKINISVENGGLNVTVRCGAFNGRFEIADFGARVTKAIAARKDS